MSLTINVYAVSQEKLKQAMGSASQQLIDAIIATEADLLENVDDIDDDAEHSCADAIRFLISGKIDQDCPGYLYGYGLEAICAHLGTPLPNICGISKAYAWMDEIDTILNANAVPVSLSDLVCTGSPVPIPDPTDYPTMGQWPADTILPALTSMRSIDLSKLDGDFGETIVQMCDWLVETSKIPNQSIIGFLS